MNIKLLLQLFHRPRIDEGVEDLHQNFISAWRAEAEPFGLSPSFEDPAPVVRPDALVAVKHLKIPKARTHYSFKYIRRSGKLVTQDSVSFDDVMTCQLAVDEEHYCDLQYRWLPKFASAFRCYRAQVSIPDYAFNYTDWGWNEWADRPTANPTYHRLKADKSIDMDERNNIFTLHPAMFWDEELCIRALNCGPEEIVRRLLGHAAHCQLVGNGVHLVLSNNFRLTYEQYVEMNDTFGKMLGLAR
ncbi:hypothetical protein [Roseateles sp. MS654]|uniref:hypothetical protein n=1 Tax=Roseateles sp. MS654 TaxID=3412685 RepID=UPI003C2D0DC5